MSLKINDKENGNFITFGIYQFINAIEMNRSLFPLLFLFLMLGCTNSKVNTPEVVSPPNILFIMSDDHAEQAISAYGSKMIETPHIDRIAKEGILFKNSFVTNSICAPSRAVLLTGKYSHLNGLRDNRDQFDGSQQTFPKLLQQAGYQTSVIGKWHLKTHPTGFDYWNILINQGHYYNPEMVEMGKDGGIADTSTTTGYTSDVITDIALATLEKRDKNKPFCMLYHHKAPHRNWMPHPRDFGKYKDIPMPDNFWDDYATRSTAASTQDMHVKDMFLSLDMKLMPEDYEGIPVGTGGGGGKFDPTNNWVNSNYGRMTDEQKAAWNAYYDPIRKKFRDNPLSGKALVEFKYQRYMEDYLGSVKAVDDNIGRVLKYLDDNDLAENTLVIYTSDQGFYLGEHGWYDKRFMYEESMGMPLVARFPKAIPAGQVNEDLVMNLDFAPTFLDYAGVDIPDDFQGKSLRSVLAGKTPTDWRKSVYYEYFEYPHGWHSVKQHYGVRTDRYKLIHFYNDIDAWELYDLEKDASEMNNLIDHPDYQDIVQELKVELERLRKDLKVI